MKLTLVTVFSLVSCISCYNAFDNNLGEYDCCPLVWKPLTATPSGRYIPSDAIIAGQDDAGRSIYFANVSSNIGVISATDTSRAFACLGTNGSIKNVTEDIFVLSNPYSCQIEWHKLWNDKGDWIMMFNSIDHLVPVFYAQYFVRANVTNDGVHVGQIFHPGKTAVPTPGTKCEKDYAPLISGDLWSCSALDKTFCKDVDVLAINCKTSLLDALSFELFDIEINTANPLFATSKDEEIEETVEEIVLENLSNLTRISSVHLAKSMTKSVHFEEVNSKYTKDTSYKSTDWGINGRVKASVGGIMKLLGVNIEAEVSGGYHSNQTTTSLVETFAKTGKMTTESVESFSKFDQDIELPPFSRTTFTVKTNPKKGTTAFKSFYRITSPFTVNHTLNALLRLGFDTTSYTIKNDTLIVTKEGTMDVSSGVNTYVKIESTSHTAERNEL